MATAAKKAAEAPKAVETPAVPALDFSSLTATDAPASAIKHSRKSNVDLTPLENLLKASKTEDKPKRFTVLAAQAPALVNKIREAAKNIDGMGVAIKVDKAEVEGQVHVNFKGKNKAHRLTKAEKAAKAEADKLAAKSE